MTHRRLAYLRILDGLSRLILEHPSIHWFISESEEAFEAEKRVQQAIYEFENGAPLSTVRDTFKHWADIQIENAKPRTLFGG